MLSIIRWILGYVYFEAYGLYPEKFINLTAKYGFVLWNIKKRDHVLGAYIAASQYKKIRYSARKSGLKLRVKKRYGLPFFLRRFKPRMGIVAGIVVFFLILYVMSLFIWQINVEGVESIPKEKVISTMKEIGLDEGKLKKDINIRMLEQMAMENIDGVSWLSVNIRGSVATVSLKERIKPPEIVPKDKPCNIKAKLAGQVSRIEVYDGAAEVNVGDAVFEGQLLINGIVEDVYGGHTTHHADGKIFAYTQRTLKEEVPIYQTTYRETGKSMLRASAKIFGANIPLTFNTKPKWEYKKEYEKKCLTIFERQLPIKVYKQTFKEQIPEDIVLTEDQAREIAENNINKKEEEILKDVNIIDRHTSGNLEDDVYVYECSYYCEENIAQAEELLIN